jgi:hypothetical protein
MRRGPVTAHARGRTGRCSPRSRSAGPAKTGGATYNTCLSLSTFQHAQGAVDASPAFQPSYLPSTFLLPSSYHPPTFLLPSSYRPPTGLLPSRLYSPTCCDGLSILLSFTSKCASFFLGSSDYAYFNFYCLVKASGYFL